MSRMNRKLKIYVSFIIIIGCTLFIKGLADLSITKVPSLLFFVLLVLVAEAVPIKMNNNIAISVSFGVGLAAILVIDSSIIQLVGFFPMLFLLELVDGKIKHIFNTAFIKRIFNASAFAISLVCASLGYQATYSIDIIWFNQFNIFAIWISVIIFSIFDTGIYLILASLLEQKSLIKIITQETWLIVLVDFIAIAPFGIIIATLYNYNKFAVFLFLGPLLLARFSYKLYVDMKKMYSETISALSNAVDAKDQYTSGHSHRVAEYAVEISRRMGFNEAQIDKIRTAAILHDIGKIGVNENILNKPGKLEEHEFVEIRKHPEIGSNILLQVSNLSEIAKIIMYHHERYDGEGYPSGIGKDQVPIESYIISVSDAYDAMTTNRPYRPALDRDVAIQIIIDEAGKQFHPDVVKAFVRYMGYTEEQLIYAS